MPGFNRMSDDTVQIRRLGGAEPQLVTFLAIASIDGIVKKRLNLDASLYTLLQILSVTLFEKMPLHQALDGDQNRCNASQITNQLNLFDF